MAEERTIEHEQVEPIKPIDIGENRDIYTEINDEPSRDWRRIATFAGMALIVALIVVFGARWIYHAVSSNSTPAPNTSQQTKKNSTSNTPQQGATPNTQGSSGSSTPNNQSATNQSGGTAATGNQLPNNGPGDVAAIFLASAIAAGGLHYIISLHRTEQ